MQVNIYGGSAKHPNNGSCSGIAQYLEHEKEGQFFSQTQDNTPRAEVVQDLDSNKGQLMKKDAKFFVIEVNPSKAELQKMGNTAEEREQALKNFVRENVIPEYAKNFNKGLTEDDIKYHAMIHHTRGKKDELQTHCHIVVSRKDQANKVKLSPMTTHKATTKGRVQGGFNRSEYYNKIEKEFDRRFKYERGLAEKYEHKNALKNGTPKQRLEAENALIKEREAQILINAKQAQEQTDIQSQMKAENEKQQEQTKPKLTAEQYEAQCKAKMKQEVEEKKAQQKKRNRGYGR